MGYSNNMTNLINKIERRLGTSQMNLPKQLQKSNWGEIIEKDTIPTFSRYIPHKIDYTIDPLKDKYPNENYYLLDENIFNGDVKILGIRDIKWSEFNNSCYFGMATQGYGIYDMYTTPYSLDDIALTQLNADMSGLFNVGLFPEYQYPNKIYIRDAANNNAVSTMRPFKIEVLIEHSPNLTTISPTKMEVFEDLAKSDIAGWLFGELKYYDNLETVLANIDLKLSDLENEKNRRDEYVGILKDSYVSAGNENQPLMYST